MTPPITFAERELVYLLAKAFYGEAVLPPSATIEAAVQLLRRASPGAFNDGQRTEWPGITPLPEYYMVNKPCPHCGQNFISSTSETTGCCELSKTLWRCRPVRLGGG